MLPNLIGEPSSNQEECISFEQFKNIVFCFSPLVQEKPLQSQLERGISEARHHGV